MHTPLHKPGQVHTGYYTRDGKPKFDYFPGTRNSQVVGVNRIPEYFTHLNNFNRPGYVTNAQPRQYAGMYDKVGGGGILNTVKDQASSGSPLMSDLSWGLGLLGEGIDFVGESFAKNVVDPTGKYVFGDKYNPMASEWEPQYNPTLPEDARKGAPFEEIPDAGFASKWAKKTIDEEFRASKDPDYQNYYEQLSDGEYKTWEEFKSDPLIAGMPSEDGMFKAINPSNWGEAFNNSKLKLNIKNNDQSNVTDIIKTTNNPDLIDTSNNLSPSIDEKDNIDMSNEDEKKGWRSKITDGINGFMDRLGDPGFQTALAMHMEAKNGGDATDVLFAGVKTNQKVSNALMQSKMNELKLLEMGLDIETKTKKLIQPEAVTDSMKGIINSLLAKYELKRPGLLEGATATISSRAMEYVAQGMSEIDAAQKAMQDASGALTPDKWFDQFWGKGGGEFDIMQMAPNTFGTPQVKYFTDAAGQTVVFDGTSYRYADGTVYNPQGG